MQPLLLPAPTFRVCAVCGISSYYADGDGDVGLYFVEHVVGSGNERQTYCRCDLCEEDICEDDIRAKISISRGVPEWLGEDDAFFGFGDMPVICVTQDVKASWMECKPHASEVWLFCRTKAEWRSAWQIARVIARKGEWPAARPAISWFLPAHKPAGAGHLALSTMRLNHHAPTAGPLVGICDSCGHAGTIVKARHGTQWMECADCNIADSAPREEGS